MIWVFAYLSAIVLANFSVATFGPASTPINAFLLIALDLVARDRLHDAWSHKKLAAKMIALIVCGGALSYVLNPATGTIAIASSVSFAAASMADAGVYHILRRRNWMQRSNGSNVAGAAVDSLLFPTLAFGALMPSIVLAQFVAKVGGGIFWSFTINHITGRIS